MRSWPGAIVLAALGVAAVVAAQQTPARPAASIRRPNVIIFVADGLRHDSVTAAETPALWRVRTEGVHFANSFSLFPTFTTPNASAIATGHGLGDTGDFSNTVWIGHQSFAHGTFGRAPGNPVVNLESDQVIGDLDREFQGNFLGRDTLLGRATAEGYETATIGKVGAAAIQRVDALVPVNGAFAEPPLAIVVDDATGTPAGVPLPAALVSALAAEHLPAAAPTRSNGYGATSPDNNGYGGDATHPGTRAADVVQVQWMADVTTRAILPLFTAARDRPFALVFWCRDPDGSQHDQGDSLGTLTPGINGPTSRLGVENADHALGQLLAWLDSHPEVKAATDVLVTSDHGFATASRREIDRAAHRTASPSAMHDYRDARGQIEVPAGTLPPGFLAMDLARGLGTKLFDPARPLSPPSPTPYRELQLDGPDAAYPSGGSALLGPTIAKADGSDAVAVVAANGGSDLVYVPDGRVETVRRLVDTLLRFDYVGGLFVDDRFGRIGGTLPESAIGLVGTSRLPRPAIVVTFKVFDLTPGDIRSGVQLVDSSFQEGQGMHGGFGRDSTFNNMAAMGPDFRAHAVDDLPVGNADIAPTLAAIMRLEMSSPGPLAGRVAREALRDGRTGRPPAMKSLLSTAADGVETRLEYAEVDGHRYAYAACLVASGSQATCR